MRHFTYSYPAEDGSEVQVTLSEEEILQEFWEYWEGQMLKKYDKTNPIICEANCIEDWVTVNWAEPA